MMHNNTRILHADILACILARLPVKSLVRFMCTCKSWCNLIKHDPSFSDLHSKFFASGYLLKDVFSRSPHCVSLCDGSFVDYEKLIISLPNLYEVISSHNGLVCVIGCYGSSTTIPLCLWNLSIRKAKPIPPPPSILVAPVPHLSWSDATVGFGFCQRSKDYKVVKIELKNVSKDATHDCKAIVEVYSLATDSWKRIKTHVPARWYFWTKNNQFGHTVIIDSGQAHCLAANGLRMPSKYAIVSFNLDNKEIEIVMAPDGDYSEKTFGIGIYKDLLSLFLYPTSAQNADGDIWVFKDRLWTKLFSIQLRLCLRTVNFGHNVGILVSDINGCEFITCDHETGEVKTLGLSLGICDVRPYKESLALLNVEHMHKCYFPIQYLRGRRKKLVKGHQQVRSIR